LRKNNCTHRKRSERMGTWYAKKLRAHRTATGLSFFLGASGCIYIFYTWTLMHMNNYVRIEQPRGSVFFWELLGLNYFLHIDSYVYDTLVELIFSINHQQTTKREAWFGTNSASTLYEDRAAKGLRFFVGASGCFYFVAPGLT
jgi:hypothetical protein